MKQNIFVIMIIATAAILPSLVTGSLNPVMAQGQNMTGGNTTAGNMTAGNMTETESLTTAGETGLTEDAYYGESTDTCGPRDTGSCDLPGE